MDRHRCALRALPFTLYRHDENIEREAIQKYCKFHCLHVNDIPREVLLMEIQMSSLSTAGWAPLRMLRIGVHSMTSEQV